MDERAVDLTAAEPDKYPPHFDPEIVKAIHWCRLGRVRPDDDGAFHRAKQLGLLAQDDTWRATEQGEGVLIALGLLDGRPAPERSTVHVLWAVSEHFSRPHFVAAFSDGMVDCWPEEYKSRREQAELHFSAFGDERWRFFVTAEYIATPEAIDA